MKDVMKPSVYGIGYIGEGKYVCYLDGNRSKEHIAWSDMLRRGYSPIKQRCHACYAGVTVCDEWHNFQNFAEWYTTQPNYQRREYHLDKDLLIPGNKVYSPDACALVPRAVNLLFGGKQLLGKWPRGVCLKKGRNKFSSEMGNAAGKIHLGYFTTPEEAHEAYRVAKTKLVRETANLYKDSLDPRVYKVLSEYEEPLDRGRHNIEIGIH